MVYPKEDFKRYYFPTYFIWVILGPSFLLAGNYPYSYTFLDLLTFQATFAFFLRILSIYMIFGVVWPLMIVVYPAFYEAIARKYGMKLYPWEDGEFWNLKFSLINIPGSAIVPLILYLIAFYGPIISFFISLYLHKKGVQKRDGKTYSWVDFLQNFI